MFVIDELGDHIVETCYSISLVTALHVERHVSLCLPHLVEERTLWGVVLDVLAAVFLIESEFRIEGETQYFWIYVHV